MDLAQRIQAKTDNGDTIIDFLVEAMTDQLDHFKMNHRLQAARLLTKYGCSCRKSDLAQRDEGIAFILNNLPEPSQDLSTAGSSDDSEFDQALAKKIQQATDDGATVCRFLINVMEGELKAFKPHHRIQAARELLNRGFGKHARQEATFMQSPPLPLGEGWDESLPRTRSGGENHEHQPNPSHTSEPSPRRSGGGRNPEEGSDGGAHPSTETTQPTNSKQSPNPTNQSNVTPYSDTGSGEDDQTDWDDINPIIDAAKEESDRILREQGIDPDNPPYPHDFSVFDEAADNSHRWFHEWKNSIDPEEYQAIIKETAERFSTKLDARIERRKQIKADRERRERRRSRTRGRTNQGTGRSQGKTRGGVSREERGRRPRPTSCQRGPRALVSHTPAFRHHSDWLTAVTPSASCTTDQSTIRKTTKAAPTTGTVAHHCRPASSTPACDPVGVTSYHRTHDTDYRAKNPCKIHALWLPTSALCTSTMLASTQSRPSGTICRKTLRHSSNIVGPSSPVITRDHPTATGQRGYSSQDAASERHAPEPSGFARRSSQARPVELLSSRAHQQRPGTP